MKLHKIVVLSLAVVLVLASYGWAEPGTVVFKPGKSNKFVSDYGGMSIVPISVGVYVGGYGDGKIESRSYGEVQGSPKAIGGLQTRLTALLTRVDLKALENVRDQITGGHIVFRYKFASNNLPTIQLYEIDPDIGNWEPESVSWKRLSGNEKGFPAVKTGEKFGEMRVEGAGGKIREAKFEIPASVLSEWAAGNNPGLLLKIKDWKGGVKIETVHASGGNTPELHVEGEWNLDEE